MLSNAIATSCGGAFFVPLTARVILSSSTSVSWPVTGAPSFGVTSTVRPVLAYRMQRLVYTRAAYFKGEVTVGIKAGFFYSIVELPVDSCTFADIKAAICVQKYFDIIRRPDPDAGCKHIAAFQQRLQQRFNAGFGCSRFHYQQKERGHRVSPFVISLCPVQM